jgi:hypothetical protein
MKLSCSVVLYRCEAPCLALRKEYNSGCLRKLCATCAPTLNTICPQVEFDIEIEGRKLSEI